MATAICLLTLGLCNLGANQMQEAKQSSSAPRLGLFGTGSNALGLGSISNTVGGLFNQQQREPQSNSQSRERFNYQAGGAPQQTACEQVFRYNSDGRQWKGVIELYNNEVNREIQLEALFIVPSGTPQNVSTQLEIQIEKAF
jgi:hypothetical protein